MYQQRSTARTMSGGLGEVGNPCDHGRGFGTENVFSRFILKQLESSHSLSWSTIQRLLMSTEIIQARIAIKTPCEFVMKRVGQVL